MVECSSSEMEGYECGAPTCGLPGCIMQLAATFIKAVCTIKIHNNLDGQVYQLLLFFSRAACKSAHNDRCSPWPWKGWTLMA